VKLEPGSVVLTPAEVATLRAIIEQWETVGIDGIFPLIVLGETVRDLLTQASDDERKPVVR
jgi:hypothetical protein